MNTELIEEIESNLEQIQESSTSQFEQLIKTLTASKVHNLIDTSKVETGDVVYSSKILGDVEASKTGLFFKSYTFKSYIKFPGQSSKPILVYPDTIQGTGYTWSAAEKHIIWLLKNYKKGLAVASKEFEEKGMTSKSDLIAVFLDATEMMLVFEYVPLNALFGLRVDLKSNKFTAFSID